MKTEIANGKYLVHCTVVNIPESGRSETGALPLDVKDGKARVVISRKPDDTPLEYVEVELSVLREQINPGAGVHFEIEEVLDGSKLKTDSS